MSLYSAAQMGQQLASQQPGGVAYGHVPQQPNLGLGPNRYVPPTFNWGRGGLDGRQPQYNQMDWNQMQAYYMPQHQNSPFTGGYMGQLQQMLGMFGNQYGGPNRQPTMPQFSSYNPGFGGPTSFFDQMRGGGVGGGGRGSDPYAAYLEYQQNNPNGTDPGFNIGGPGQRAATLSREQYSQWLRDTASGMYDNMYPDPYGRGGGMGGGGRGRQRPPGYFDGPGSIYDNMSPEGRAYMEDMATWSQDRINREAADTVYTGFGGGGMGGGGGLPPGYSYDAPGDRSYTMEMPTNGGRWAYGPNGERIEVGGRQGLGADYFRNLFEGGGGGMYGREYDRRAAYEHARQQPDFDWGNYGESMDGPRMPYGGNGGGFGGRGGYPTMPQFNPYMLARNNMMGMDFNQMFDPRYAMLFGMGGLGAMTPNGPQQPSGLKPGQLGGGG